MTVQRALYDSQTFFFWPSFILISAKNGKELHLVHDEGHLPTCLLRKSWEMEKFGKSPGLNSAIVNCYKQRQQRWRYGFCWLASFYYLLCFLGFDWLRQTVLYLVNRTVFLFLKGKPYLKLSKLILNWTVLKNAERVNFSMQFRWQQIRNIGCTEKICYMLTPVNDTSAIWVLAL